ncbi:MAG: hypothetical protein U0559_05765 [Anaerolineae bacterium]
MRTVNGGIAKTVTFSPPPTATLGTLVTYTLSAPQTPLNVTLYNVQITDTINPSMTIVSVDAIGVGSLITQTSQSITTTFTSVPSYTQAFVTITARIDTALNARSGTLISNTAYLTHSTSTALTNTQTVTTLVGEPTLTVTKRVVSSAGNVNAVDGLQTLTYTLRLTNTGTSPAYDVVITDMVPQGISVTALLDGYTHSEPVQGQNPLTWTIASISNAAPNNAIVLSYTARISGAVASNSSSVRLTNTVTSTWSSLSGEVTGERSYGPITATATITPARPGLIKSVSPTSNNTTNQLKVGDVITYSVVVTVPPRLIVWWPYMYDDLPVGVRLITPSLTLTSTLAFTAPDAYASAALYASSPSGVLGATSTSNPRVGQTEAAATGESIEWWLDPLDNSQSDATGYVTMTFRAQLTGIARNGTVQWTDALAVSTLTNNTYLYWNAQNQGAYVTNTLTQTVNANVNSYVGQPLLHINKTYTTPVTCSGTLLEDAFNSSSTTLANWTNVTNTWTINTSLGQATLSAGTTLAGATVRNTLNTTDFGYSANARSTDTTSSLGLLFRYTNANNYYLYRVRINDGGNNVQLQKMSAGLLTTLYTVTVTPSANRWYNLEVRAEGNRLRGYLDGVQQFDVTDGSAPLTAGQVGLYANNCAVNSCAFDDVFVTKLNTTACTVSASDLVTYTVTITNHGTTPAFNLIISDVLPAELSYVSSALITAPIGTTLDSVPTPGATGTLTWSVNYLSGTNPSAIAYANMRTLQLQIVARVADTVAANTRFSNQIFAPYYDTQLDNGPSGTTVLSNDADQRTYSSAGSHSAGLQTPDGSITKTFTFDPPPTVTLGSLITYTIQVPTSPLSATLYNVQITDTLHPSMTLEPAGLLTSAGGSIVYNGQRVTATFASIVSNTFAYVTITARVMDNLGGYAGYVLTNTAYLSHSTASAITNTGLISTPIGEPALSIGKRSDPAAGSSVGAGQTVTYTVLITNAPSSTAAPAYDLIFTDTLPQWMRALDPQLITITLDGVPIDPIEYAANYTAATGVYVINFSSHVVVPVGSVLSIQYAAVVEAEVPSGVSLINRAQASWTSLAGEVTGERTYEPINTSVTLNTLVSSLSKQVTPTYAAPGDLVTYTLIAPAVPISATLYNVVITDAVDARTLALDTILNGGTGGLVTTTGSLITATFVSVPSYTQAIVTVTVRVPSDLGAVAGNTITNVAILRDDLNHTSSNITTFTVTEPALTLVKASQPPTSSALGAGDTITYAVTITNRNSITTSAAHDVLITDTLPLHLRGAEPTIVAITLNGTPIDVVDYTTGFNSSTGVYTIGLASNIDVPVNGTLFIQYAANVENTVPPGYDLINAARAAYDSQASVVIGERAYVSNLGTTTLHTAQPSLGKTVTPLFATLGDLITYTIRVPATPVNMTIYNATITDTLNVSTTFVSVTTDGGTGATTEQAGQVITANFATIPAFSQVFVTITARLMSNSGAVAGDTINNQATLSHSAGMTQSNVTTFRVVEPSLSIAKGSTPVAGSTVGAGEAIVYSVFITNASGLNVSAAHDLIITDTLPLYMRGTTPSVIALTINGSPVVDYATAYDATSGVFTVTLASNVNLAADEALRLDYQAVVDNDVPAVTALINQARVVWSSLAESITGERDYGPISATTTLHSGQPTLDKVATPSIVSLGSTVVFTLSVPGAPLSAVLSNVAVTDTIDSRLRIESVSANAMISGQLITATFASIASFAQEAIVITATVLNLPTTTNGTSITNIATLNYANNPGGLVASPIVTLTVHEPNVTLAKSVTTSRNPVGAGDIVTYTLMLNNSGDWPAHDLTITDALPSELTFVATTNINVSDPIGAITGGDYPQWVIDQLNPGGMATIAFTARIADSLGARVTVTNSAWGAYDSQPGANGDQRAYDIVTATATINTGDPAFTIVKSATPAAVNAGDALVYTVVVTNTGLVTATGVVITDAVPLNTTFASASDPHTLNSDVVSWAIGTLGVGASTLVTLAVNVASPLFNGTAITNTAHVTSNEGITGSSTIVVPVNAAHTLDIIKTANVDHVFAGRLLTYTLAYTIGGNEPALGVTISDTVPASTTYQTCSGATCNQAAGLVTWSIGTVTPIGTGVVTLTVLINSDVPSGTLVVNRTSITDNSALIATSEVSVPVWSLPAFAITKTTEITLAHANRPITYTIVVTNTGLGPATETVITDELPISTTFSSCGPAPCTQVGAIVSWTIGTLLPAQSTTVTLIVVANSDVPSDTFIYNDHYGVTCAELPPTTGTPVQVPTNVRLQTMNARSSATTNWGNMVTWLTLTMTAAIVWIKRRPRR